MKNSFSFVVFITAFLLTTTAMSQVFDAKTSEVMSDPMNRVVAQHQAMFNDVGFAGDVENNMTQDQRYNMMTSRFNAAERRHVESNNAYRTIDEITPDFF